MNSSEFSTCITHGFYFVDLIIVLKIVFALISLYCICLYRKWIPGCGTHLIVNQLARKPAKPISNKIDTISHKLCTPAMHISTADFPDHIDIFTQFGDLTPSQMLTLYLQFVSWPGFKRSPFQASMESSLIKMETSSESLIEDIPFQEQAEDEVEVTLVKKNVRDGKVNVD